MIVALKIQGGNFVTNFMIHVFMHEKNVEFGNLIPGQFSLLEGNICNFDEKCTIKMYISVFFFQKNLKFVK